jgi:hypothetical protein
MQSRLAYRLLNLPYHHSLLSLFPPDIPRSLATPHNYSDHFISRDWKQNYKSLRQYSSILNRIFSYLRLSIQSFCQYYPPQLDPSLPAINFATPTQYSISKNDKPTATTEHLNFLQHNTDGSKGQSLGSAFVKYYKGNILCEHKFSIGSRAEVAAITNATTILPSTLFQPITSIFSLITSVQSVHYLKQAQA